MHQSQKNEDLDHGRKMGVASQNSPGIRLHQNFGGTDMHHQFSSRIADMLGWDQTLLWMPFNKETTHKRFLSHTQHAAKEWEGYQSVLERNEG